MRSPPDVPTGPEPGAAADVYGAALDAWDDGFVLADREGVPLRWNRAARRYRDARGTDSLVVEALERALVAAARGEIVDDEVALYGPPRRVIQLRAVPLGASDSERAQSTGPAAVAFLRDVTDTRRLEQVRRDFVANVSHELKTPMGALALLAETLTDSEDPALMVQLAGKLALEADRLARIVDDLLELSVLESQASLPREQVAVVEIVDEAASRVATTASAVGVEIIVEPVLPGLLVRGDRRQLVSALANLLDNAVKYSAAGSAVVVVVSSSLGRVEIAVADHGVGIPSRDLVRVFERFYRVDRARSRATGGTGLGLSIVRHVAEIHGGEATVESVEGDGSTFRFIVPREGSDPAPARGSRDSHDG